MSVPQTTNEVGLQLARLGRELDRVKAELNDADLAAVRAREVFKVAEAKATVSSEGSSADLRKADTVLRTHDERLAAETADAIVRGLVREMTAIRVRIDVGRTLGAGIRSETALGGYGGAA